MKYDVTLRMTLKSSSDADRIRKQIESVFEFGTVGEAFAEGLVLNEEPHLVDVSVCRLAAATRSGDGIIWEVKEGRAESFGAESLGEGET